MIIQSKRVLINGEFIPASLHIENGIIAKITEYSSNAKAIDMGDLLVTPGIVDLHSDALEKRDRAASKRAFSTRICL